MRGPVSRVLSWTAIYLGRALPRASSHLHRDGRAGLVSLSTVLLRIEFTAPTCLQAAGELLPRLSTLTTPPQSPLASASVHRPWPCPGASLAPSLLPRRKPAALSGGGLRGGISLLHLSEGFPWRVLPVIPALWSPDFPHARAFALYARPPGPLPEHFTPLAGTSQYAFRPRGRRAQIK